MGNQNMFYCVMGSHHTFYFVMGSINKFYCIMGSHHTFYGTLSWAARSSTAS